ncbi:MAG: serine hydrolase domain-containing protein, partial [Chitinophagaceae bacterium]
MNKFIQQNLIMLKKIIGLFFLPLALIANAQPERADSAIASIMNEFSVTGISLAVVKNHKIIYNQSFGYQNISESKPLANNHLFRIASISKSFSATAIMQLVEQRKISLDDDVSNLIGFRVRHPKFPDKIITLRLLLSHRSSLNDRQGYFNLDVLDPSTSNYWAKCYNDYAPGEKYQYCNLNFNILGTIIERVSGKRFDQYIKHHILDPLGIYGGYCVDSLD